MRRFHSYCVHLVFVFWSELIAMFTYHFHMWDTEKEQMFSVSNHKYQQNIVMQLLFSTNQILLLSQDGIIFPAGFPKASIDFLQAIA